jgi:uncharacterized membrane protein YccC
LHDFLGDQAQASELRQLREALEDRLRRLRAESESDPKTREELRLKIDQVRRQIQVLAEEEAISGFVEESVRAVVADMGAMDQDSAPHDSNLPAWASIDIDDVPEE